MGEKRKLLAVALLAVLTFPVTVKSQTVEGEIPPVLLDLNSELRSNTWSVYAQGGLSWATGVWYESIDAKRSYGLSPAVGGGIDYNIRPWIRVGVEYLWSNFRREQRQSTLDPSVMPMKAYGNYLMNYHNGKLGVGLNFMELWPKRKAQWFNIYLGTGVGYTVGRGNEYGIWFSNTLTRNGETVPITGDINVSNESTLTINGGVTASNRHEGYECPYVPASLHIEADLCRRVTIGLKGEMDWILKRGDIAPKNYILGLATLRYNFVPNKVKAVARYYAGEVASLEAQVNDLQKALAESKAAAEKAGVEIDRLNGVTDDLRRGLDECEESKKGLVPAEKVSHVVYFPTNSSRFSKEEGEALKAFAATVHGKRLSLLAESSTSGASDYNQVLSEKRMERVIDALVEAGIPREDIHPTIAIGERNGIATVDGQRVTIVVEE